MGKFLSVDSKGGTVAIAICPRCSFKYHYDELRQDPNTKQWVCKDCCDIYDPWRLPALVPENITLTHPRPDDSVVTSDVPDTSPPIQQ